MKISYAITVCNEFSEISRLLPLLLNSKREQDEIVVLYDTKNGTVDVEEYLRSMSIAHLQGFVWVGKPFDNHFADWKNTLTRLCTGDYIFNIDADEYPHEYLISNIHNLLEQNPSVDMFIVPRINTVEGITQDHIKQWGWNVDNKGWVNFPDYQSRVYRRNGEIMWANKVHERVINTRSYAYLPDKEHWCLYHPKTIERQEKQNNYYNTL
jgi:hypothetical protein